MKVLNHFHNLVLDVTLIICPQVQSEQLSVVQHNIQHLAPIQERESFLEASSFEELSLYDTDDDSKNDIMTYRLH